MKKVLLIAMMSLLLVGCAFCEEAAVYVSITNSAGEVVMAYEKIGVTDVDGDGILSMHDALTCAHNQKYTDESGYVAEKTEYGISLVRLWGEENNGCFGYYLNHQSAWSLLDPVQAGDHVKVYAFTDLETWSDTYTFFDWDMVEARIGDSVELSLTASGFDAAWNAVAIPVQGATIVIDGEKSVYSTDEAGTATVVFASAGVYTISAESDTMNIVPPVCIVNVKGN